jgi:hypothetical protein
MWRNGWSETFFGLSFVLATAGAFAGCSGSTAVSSGATVASTIDRQLVINEILALNALSNTDENGKASPWIEIYNPTGQDVSLEGYGVTDDFNQPHKSVLPAGVSVPAGGYVLLWCDSNPMAGPKHVGITLFAPGASVGLSRPDGSFIERLTYGAQTTDLSASREPDGSANWVTEWGISPGAANPTGNGQPVGAQASGDPPEAVPAATDISDQVLGYDQLPQFDLQVSDSAMATLASQSSATQAATWVPATITFAGRTYGPIGIDLKGTSSFEPIDKKPAFRLNFNKYSKDAAFLGLKEILLNNMVSDPSMTHERLSYWLGRQLGGMPIERANNSWVTLNGAPLGLYLTLEEPKDQMMERYFPDAATGTVFTINYADFTAADINNFQLQDGPDDLTLINGLTSALAMSSAVAAMNAAQTSVNMQEFTLYWAYVVLVGKWGGWPYAPTGETIGANTRIYCDPMTKQIYFIPEGIDDAFLTADYDFINNAKSVLTQKCAADSSCFQQFSSQLSMILAKAQQLDWTDQLTHITTQIAPYVPMDTRKPYTDADVATYQQQANFFMTSRSTYITKYLVPPK